MHRSLSIEHKHYWNRSVAYSICQFVCLCVCPESVLWQKVEHTQMSFGVVSVVGRGMGVLDGVVIIERKGQFWG